MGISFRHLVGNRLPFADELVFTQHTFLHILAPQRIENVYVYICLCMSVEGHASSLPRIRRENFFYLALDSAKNRVFVFHARWVARLAD